MTQTSSKKSSERLKTNWTKWSSTRIKQEASQGNKKVIDKKGCHLKEEDGSHLTEDGIHRQEEEIRRHEEEILRNEEEIHLQEESTADGKNHRREMTTKDVEIHLIVDKMTTDHVTSKDVLELQKNEEVVKENDKIRPKDKGQDRQKRTVGNRQ